jgi:hypothetical protein
MSDKTEILFEGSYLYYEKDVNYSQENFKLVQVEQNFHIYAEVLSRIENGEFLKILVRYEMNHHFMPLFVRIEKSIGNRYAQENYKLDTQSQTLTYSFQNAQVTQDFSRPVSAKHYLTTPAVSTSALFTLSKKFDATGRTAIVLLSSQNDWTYLGPPEEKIIYAEFKSKDLDFQLNNNNLSASHLCLYENDSSHSAGELPVNLYLSKHFAIPYQLQHGTQKIIIKNLKKNS